MNRPLSISNILHPKEFLRCAVTSILLLGSLFSAVAKDYYVTPSGQSNGVEGSKWNDAGVTTLQLALNAAVAGDVVHLLGYNDAERGKNVYIAPKTGFNVKSGVTVRGGYAPDGTRPTYGLISRFQYRSVVSADSLQNDEVSREYFLFLGNSTRVDNAVRCFNVDVARTAASQNTAGTRTVIEGLTIHGGCSVAAASRRDDSGGGIYVYASESAHVPFSIRNCFFVNNQANFGGGIYVDKSCSVDGSYIEYCEFMNNASASRLESVNNGGAICLDGVASIVNSTIYNNINGGVAIGTTAARVVNSTIANNTVSAIELTAQIANDPNFSSGTRPEVYNSIWCNETLSSNPRGNLSFHYCAAQEFLFSDFVSHNIFIPALNDVASSLTTIFVNPSTIEGYDFVYDYSRYGYSDFSWAISSESIFVNQGDNNAYSSLGISSDNKDRDMMGRTRIAGDIIDIGAYEALVVAPNAHFYVKTKADGGDDANDGLSWTTAFASVQTAIDAAASAAATSGGMGEVWIAEGTYYPNDYLDGANKSILSFRMRDGVNVYGGFAGTEEFKDERTYYADQKPWQYAHETVLCGAGYKTDNNDRDLQWNASDCRWTGATSTSSHVVWFAPLQDEAAFATLTTLDGVTIKGGHAQASSVVEDDYYHSQDGAGVYMAANTTLQNCIVTECVADGVGGAIYSDLGRVNSSLICSNSATRGGGVYIVNAGSVMRSLILNNGAHSGSGIYMKRGTRPANELILATSIVNSNSCRANGAVYCDQGGTIIQSTITNNNSLGTIDDANHNSPRTGGLFVNGYVRLVNSVLWNNRIATYPVQVYIVNPSRANTQFYYSAISDKNFTVWNDTWQENIYLLSSNNHLQGESSADYLAPNFTNTDKVTDDLLNSTVGVIPIFPYNQISYYWQPAAGSPLRAKGALSTAVINGVLLMPKVDLSGNAYDIKPTIGASSTTAVEVHHQVQGNKYIVYVDSESKDIDDDGSSWSKPYHSLQGAVEYFASIDNVAPKNVEFEIQVLECTIAPWDYFANNDPRSASIYVHSIKRHLAILGGYSRADVANGNFNPARSPQLTRTIISGDNGGSLLDDALYHLVRVADDIEVTIDGFYITTADASYDRIKGGAGIMVGNDANVTLRNSVVANCRAPHCAAIEADKADKLTMENCVIANNTSTDEKSNVIVSAKNLDFSHCTFVNNYGEPFTYSLPDAYRRLTNCLIVGNSRNGSNLQLSNVPVDKTVFTNPTKAVGASFHFDSYYGGYPSFLPLTSSAHSSRIINCGTTTQLSTDITLAARSRGGAPDLGAYEAELPEDGTVIYVRKDGNDSNDGLAWNRAKATITAALNVSTSQTKAVWVAAGTYTERVTMKQGIDVLGGFSAVGTPDNILDDNNRSLSNTDQRFMTTIDGNNQGRVLTQSADFNTLTTWEGFIIQNGYSSGGDATSNGGGVYLSRNGRLKNCIVQYCHKYHSKWLL